MIDLAPRDCCTGCSACRAICPKNAISFVEDELGFSYPKIDETRCINCGACQRVCPVLKQVRPADFSPACYVARTNDKCLLEESSSGGMFSELALCVLKKSGVVFGCVFENNVAVHKSARTPDEIAPMRGSKYVQSNVRDTFRECRECLKAGQMVMYTGTPCQIAGLKSFLEKDYENLFTVGIICHGVASPKALSNYLKEEETRHKDRIESISFRDKKSYPGRISVMIKFSHSWETHSWENVYMRAFLSGCSYRENCFKCHFRSGRSRADIVIGDFWGIENIRSDYSMKEGASAILAYTDKGRNFVERLNVRKDGAAYADISKYNDNLDNDALKSKERNAYLESLRNNESLVKFFKTVDYVPLWLRAVRLPMRVLKKILRMIRSIA